METLRIENPSFDRWSDLALQCLVGGYKQILDHHQRQGDSHSEQQDVLGRGLAVLPKPRSWSGNFDQQRQSASR